VTLDDVIAEINQNKNENPCLIYTYKLSPFSSEALALLEVSGYEYTNIEVCTDVCRWIDRQIYI